jgi:hypothetical protein
MAFPLIRIVALFSEIAELDTVDGTGNFFTKTQSE